MKSFIDRRSLVKFLVANTALSATALWAGSLPTLAKTPTPFYQKPIPKTGQMIPAIGMGSWITFNVGNDEFLRNERTKVLRAFFEVGGGLLDSSPMYGSSQEVIGYGLQQLNFPKGLFSATKVWTNFQSQGVKQIKTAKQLWGVKQFDLLQIHNLAGWEKHLATLTDMKEKGRLRYIGITTSHGRRHDEVEQIMKTKNIDFVQFTYNMHDREAEQRLLPLAKDKGIAVIINRPFQRGALISHLASKPLPAFAKEIDCKSWPQFLLKFIISHPAVTCAIPATSKVTHCQENMATMHGTLPDAKMRAQMSAYVDTL